MNIEELFWSQIDPLYHLKQASCIRYTRDIDRHYRMGDHASKETDLGAELLDGLDDMKASALMFIRFHAIETLLTVLLGSAPHGPVPRFAKKFFGAKFNDAVRSVGHKEIPTALEIPGVSGYDRWISAKFWGGLEVDQYLDEDVIEFISVQAEIFRKKTVYNAFKHGCSIGRSSPKISVQDERTGEFLPLWEISSGVGWINWEEDRRSKTASVTIGALSCNPDEDHAAIAIMALLVRAMKTIRLGSQKGKVEIQMPTGIKAGMRAPDNLVLRLTFPPA